MATKEKKIDEAPSVEGVNHKKYREIVEAYKKQSPIQYEIHKLEYETNLAKSDEEIGLLISP